MANNGRIQKIGAAGMAVGTLHFSLHCLHTISHFAPGNVGRGRRGGALQRRLAAGGTDADFTGVLAGSRFPRCFPGTNPKSPPRITSYNVCYTKLLRPGLAGRQ